MSEAYISQSGVNRRPQGGERKATLTSAILTTSDVYYTGSWTSQGQDMSTDAGHSPYLNNFPDHALHQLAYPAEASSAPYPSVYLSGVRYLQGPGYPAATSGDLTTGHLASIRRSSAAYPNYTSEDVYYDISANSPNMQALMNPSAGGYRDPREQPRVHAQVDPKDNRRDPNDPRNPRLDPRDSGMNPRDSPKDHKDTRLDTRLGPRTVPSDSSDVTLPEGVSTQGALNDSRSNNSFASKAFLPSRRSLQSRGSGSLSIIREYPQRSLRRREEFPGPEEQDYDPVRQKSLFFTCSLQHSRFILPFPKLSSTT